MTPETEQRDPYYTPPVRKEKGGAMLRMAVFGVLAAGGIALAAAVMSHPSQPIGQPEFAAQEDFATEQYAATTPDTLTDGTEAPLAEPTNVQPTTETQPQREAVVREPVRRRAARVEAPVEEPVATPEPQSQVIPPVEPLPEATPPVTSPQTIPETTTPPQL